MARPSMKRSTPLSPSNAYFYYTTGWPTDLSINEVDSSPVHHHALRDIRLNTIKYSAPRFIDNEVTVL